MDRRQTLKLIGGTAALASAGIPGFAGFQWKRDLLAGFSVVLPRAVLGWSCLRLPLQQIVSGKVGRVRLYPTFALVPFALDHIPPGW